MAWPNNWNPRDLISAARLNQWAAALRALDAEPQRYSGQVVRGAVSVANATWTAMSFDGESFDAGNTFAPPDTKITMGAAGRGWAFLQVKFAANSAGTRALRIKQNSAVLYTYTGRASPSGETRLNVVVPVQFSAGDYFEMEVYQNSGAALNTSGAVLTVTRSWG